jgi:site-specific DNA recombinase
MTRAGIYIRVSKAKRELLDAQRQEPPCQQFCQAQGWTVEETYLDDSTSAYSGVPREHFERMLGDVRAGKLDAIVSWQMDRLLRTVEDASAIVNIARQHGTLIANIGGSIDLSTADGRRRFYESAVAAQYESDLKSERLKLKAAELAADGKWHGGQRPFGYDLQEYIERTQQGPRVKYKLVLNPEEAAAIHQAAMAVLAGRSISSIGKQWVQGGVRRPGGGLYPYWLLRELLKKPRIAGLREADGRLVQAVWPAIITREQHEELKVILGPVRPHGGGTGGLPTARTYLLSGLAYCGICGAKLRPHASGGKRRYACSVDFGGCSGIKRMAEPLEAHVTLRLLVELPERLVEAARRAPAAWESLGALMLRRQTEEDRLDGLSDLLVDGTLDKAEYLRQKKRVQARLDRLEEEIAKLRAQAPRRRIRGASGEELQAEWDRMALDERRVVLADHVERIVVKPAGPGRRFRPEQVEIIWRQAP